VASVAFLRGDTGRARRKGVRNTFIAAVLLALGGMLLMGLPGAVIYELSAPLVGGMSGALGDGAWGTAICITLTWPFSLVLAFIAAAGPLRRRGWMIKTLAWFVILYGAGILLALWAQLSAAAA
jgi:hypothetical protein